MIAAKVVGGGQIRTELLQHPTWASSLEPSSGPRPRRSHSDIVRSKYLYLHGSGIHDARDSIFVKMIQVLYIYIFTGNHWNLNRRKYFLNENKKSIKNNFIVSFSIL